MSLLGMSGCGSSAGVASGAIQERDSADVRIIENDLAALDTQCSVGEAPSLTIGEAIADAPYQLYRVFGATVLSDGTIALVNQGSEEVRFYGPEGDFLFASGGEGDGPGEFSNAFYLWKVRGDTLLVGDYNPWHYEVFSPSGEWVRQVRPVPVQANSPRMQGLLEDGRAVLGFHDFTRRSPDFSVTDSIHVLFYDADGELLDTLDTYPYGRWGQVGGGPNSTWVYPWFEPLAEMAVARDRFALAHGNAPEVRLYTVEEHPTLERIVRWAGVDLEVTAGVLQAAQDEVVARYPGEAVSRMRDLLLSDLRPVAERIPTMTDLLIGRDGALWVKEYPRPDRPDPHRWLRFTASGRFSCGLTLPDGFEVYEFGEDYVLGKREGEFGVEQIALFELALQPDAI